MRVSWRSGRPGPCPAGQSRTRSPRNRFNDGKVDRQGRFWAGTMDRAEQEASGALYRLDHDLYLDRIDSGYRVTNGPAFSLDGRLLYHTDSALQRVYAFDLAKTAACPTAASFCNSARGTAILMA